MSAPSLAVRGRVVTTRAGDPVRRDAVVEVAGGRVIRVRPVADGDGDAPAHDVLLPGLVDAHSHARGTPLAAHGVGRGPLERFLVELGAMTELDPYGEALVAAADSLAAGITATQVCHHSFAAACGYAEAARAVGAGYRDAGARAAIALTISDRDEWAPETFNAVAAPDRGVGPADFIPTAQRLAAELDDEYVRVDAVGPVAPQWAGDRLLRAVAGAARGRRVHAHLLESVRQVAVGADDPVSRMEQAGLLGASTSFAHAIWLDERQRDALARAGAVVVHCPGSNRRLNAGSCDVRALLDAGVTVALGLDSHGVTERADPFAELRLAAETAAERGARLRTDELLAMVTTAGAHALGRDDLGHLEPGASADIVALSLPGVEAVAEPLDAVLARATAADVTDVWVAGRRARRVAGYADAQAHAAARLLADQSRRRERLRVTAGSWAKVDAAWQARDTEMRAA